MARIRSGETAVRYGAGPKTEKILDGRRYSGREFERYNGKAGCQKCQRGGEEVPARSGGITVSSAREEAEDVEGNDTHEDEEALTVQPAQ
jgi:hypothetical protein